MRLVQYRDAHMKDYIYFWVNIDEIQIGPSFTNEGTAYDWLNYMKACQWDTWKPCRDIT